MSGVAEVNPKYLAEAASHTVPVGYKQTEVGVIPEDWEVKKVSEISRITTGNKNTQDKIDNGIYPFFVRSQIVERINSFSFDGEAVLTAGDGVGVGKVFHYINGKFDYHQRVYAISHFDSNISGFYFFKYFQNNFYNRIMQMTAKSSVDSVRMETIADMQIPLPPLAEQEAIAAALSDADAWIESLEQVIAKKRLIKQGAMQELLTPPSPLRQAQGSSRTEDAEPVEAWEVKKLGEVVNFKNGAAHENVVDENGEFVIVNSKFISQEGRVRKFSNAFLCPLYKNEIVMVMSDIPNGKALAKCFIIDKDNTYTLNQRICAFEAKDGFEAKYLFYKINRNDYFLAFDSGSGQTNLRRDEVLNCPIDFPSLSEQERIATILSDMDAELESLANQLAKARQIKQGMMQELLTGRVRLV